MTAIANIFNEARTAATIAFSDHTPTPVVFGQAKSLFGNEIIPGTEEYVADGLCGFAWVRIKPARGEFVKFLKKNGIGNKGVYGGYTISAYDIGCPVSSQSMERKEAACKAFVAVIKQYFPDMKIWVESRLD